MLHTKGNWIYNKYSPCDYGVYSETGNGNDIALVRGSTEEPDLLKALVLCQYQLQTWVELDSWDTEDEKAYTTAEAAIKKATE